MATHHSKTSRTKSPNAQIVVPEWDSVWRSFRESNGTTTIEAMNAKGWKTVKQAAEESGHAENYINALGNRGIKMELQKAKVKCSSGCVRTINFVRPKC
jgi:hypothetical protein